MGFNKQDILLDGFQVVNLGVNDGIAPNALSRNQAAFAVNAMFRGSFPQCRYGWVNRNLKFLDEDGVVDATLRDNFEDGLFQDGIPFRRRNSLVSQHSGRLFSIDLDTFQVTDVSITGDLNRPDLRQAWMLEVEDYVIVQDGQASPIFFNGSSSRRSDSDGVSGTKEIPTGTVMAYLLNRVWVANTARDSFIAGDIAFNGHDSYLQVTENDYLNEGGAFGIPANFGKITAMAPVAQMDTSTGQGPLIVFTEGGAFSVNAPTDRDSWKNLTYPIQSVVLVNTGATGPGAFTLVNGDVWFRSNDGVRSFITAFRYSQQWANTPQSKNVERALIRDSAPLLNFASAAVYDNILLVTSFPVNSDAFGVYHRGFVALDFNPLGLLEGQSQPVWNGTWTGFDCHKVVSGIFNGIERCFAWGRDSDGDVTLWELDKTAVFDNDGTIDKLTEWSVEGPALNYQDGGWDLKRLQWGDIWLDMIRSNVTVTAQYRPDGDPRWRDWHSFSMCANRESCLTTEQCSALDTFVPQYRARKRFPQPGNDCDSITNKMYRIGYEFQPRLSFVGPARIKKFRMAASDEDEPAVGACESDESCSDLVSCNDDPFEYRIETATNA